MICKGMLTTLPVIGMFNESGLKLETNGAGDGSNSWPYRKLEEACQE